MCHGGHNTHTHTSHIPFARMGLWLTPQWCNNPSKTKSCGDKTNDHSLHKCDAIITDKHKERETACYSVATGVHVHLRHDLC
jgi:hypothetical protein